ncbi:MAG TPA: rod shape-determining protein RodA [Rectinemataceae bacterium]|nr:rod shape-determining protein RodA [Rectinemataceae bacterium]
MKHFQLPKFLSDIDYSLLAITMALICIGVFAIASAGIDAEGFRFSNEYMKQIIWAATGALLALMAIGLDISRLKDYTFFVYAALCIVLLYTRFAGRVVNGARSWIGIGESGIQPSEFAKITTILFLARYLDDSEQQSSFRRLIISGCIIALPVLLILSQPDFGSALVFFPILIVMLYMGKIDIRYTLFIVLTVAVTFVILILPLAGKYFFAAGNPIDLFFQRTLLVKLVVYFLFIVLGLASWGWLAFKKRYYFWLSYIFSILDLSILISFAAHKVLKEYQIMRLMVFLNPDVDPQGAGWNIIQAVTAIGSGGLVGKGYMQGTQSHARFIPQQSTDFIFSIIAEEWGLAGGIVLICLFGALMYRIISLIETTKDRYSMLVCSGFFGMFFFHFMINVGMAIGIMPITGIPLYFISYGGSSLWAAMTAVGFLLGISARRYRM